MEISIGNITMRTKINVGEIKVKEKINIGEIKIGIKIIAPKVENTTLILSRGKVKGGVLSI